LKATRGRGRVLIRKKITTNEKKKKKNFVEEGFLARESQKNPGFQNFQWYSEAIIGVILGGREWYY
jgi:hypothetical protein